MTHGFKAHLSKGQVRHIYRLPGETDQTGYIAEMTSTLKFKLKRP